MFVVDCHKEVHGCVYSLTDYKPTYFGFVPILYTAYKNHSKTLCKVIQPNVTNLEVIIIKSCQICFLYFVKFRRICI